ncbi:hypothetical protein VFPPC_13563 [Pochonia chlamydosporia 170]|uniref:Uncharacterized protein n=1 Tax=Pochonia chlamydosporia 170 TaxID=1380566 RepID=A0A179FR42_METCM|nr:hypothetical protein VFPPC_13563 [Pochonia chlamydosporia 170]OAQ67680.1 hypothetical protein VFPPC_13563 [Pochonia chlamydosporia 170]
MRFTSATLVLAMAAGIQSAAIETRQKFVGTFDTFTDRDCHQGGKGVTVFSPNRQDELAKGIKAIRSYFPKCTLEIVYKNSWEFFKIPPGNSQCHQLPYESYWWKAVCP